MIFGLQNTTTASAAQDNNASGVSVSLSPKLLQLLQDAMKEAGIDPNELNTPAKVEKPASFQQLFGGISTPIETASISAAPIFTPKYKTAKGFDSSTGAVYKMNDNYFADQETAQWVASKFGTGEVRENDMLGPGPFGVDTKMFEVKMEDGRWVNAGMLASYYDRNPESLFPGLADKLIKDVLKNV